MLNFYKNTSKIFAVLIVGSSVAACNSEPSESAIADLVKFKMTDAYQKRESELKRSQNRYMTPEIIASQLQVVPQFVSLKKVDCAPAKGEAGHTCEVKLTISQLGFEQTNRAKIRFFQGADGKLALDAT